MRSYKVICQKGGRRLDPVIVEAQSPEKAKTAALSIVEARLRAEGKPVDGISVISVS